MSSSVFNYTRKDLENYFLEKNLAKFRATQVIEGVYRERVKNFQEISNLSKDVKKLLQEDFVIDELKVVKKSVASDGTTKFLFSLSDGNLIETEWKIFSIFATAIL